MNKTFTSSAHHQTKNSHYRKWLRRRLREQEAERQKALHPVRETWGEWPAPRA